MTPKEKLKSILESRIYDKTSLKQLSLPDSPTEWWIFNFKSAFFEKEIAKLIAELFWEMLPQHLDKTKPFAIGGMESGAIPLVSALVLNSPPDVSASGFFIRKSRKKTDLANIIEGEITEEAQVVIVDDILNRGSSFNKIHTVLEAENRRVSVYFSVVRYRDPSFYESKKSDGTTHITLFELNDFEKSLGLNNLVDETLFKPKFTHDLMWGLQLGNPHPYYVIPKSAPLLFDGTIYQGVDDGTFYAIDSKTGETRWTYGILFGAHGKRIYSSPARYKEKIIFGAYDGNLYALNIKTGAKEWIFFDGDWIGSSPAVADDLGLVYIGLEFGLIRKKGGVVAVNAETGESVWTYYEMTGLTHASPAYSKAHKIVVCGCNNGKIYGFDAKTGTLRWEVQTDGEVKYSAVFDDQKGMVYIASMDGNVYALKIKTGEVVRKYATLAAIYANPVLYKNTLIVGSLDKNIYCWDTMTGKELWVHKTHGRIFASGLIHEDRLYIGSNDGWLRVIDPANGKLLGKIVLPERIVNKIQVKDSVVYIPTHMCQLLAYTEKLNPETES